MAGVILASRVGLAAARPAPTASRASTSSATAAAPSAPFLRNFNGDNARFASVVARASAAEIVDAASDEADGIVPAGGRRGGRGGGRGGGRSGGRGRGDGGGRGRRDGSAEAPEFQERVVQVSRVTKVCTGGKQLSFRAVVVVGDEKGKVSELEEKEGEKGLIEDVRGCEKERGRERFTPRFRALVDLVTPFQTARNALFDVLERMRCE